MSESTRAAFDAEELAVVLSYYDLGTIESITEFARGSRRSPKVGLVADRGKFLLKRRAPQRAHPDRVRFAHRVQLHLATVGFPVAQLVATREHATYVHLRDQVYELFEFIPGQPYCHTPGESHESGAALARFHAAMDGFLAPSKLPAPQGDYHHNPLVRAGMLGLGPTLSAHDSFSGDEASLAGLVQYLLESYDAAAHAVDGLGYTDLPERIIHSDWHPGNLLFRKGRVVAVIDFDSARRSRAIVDIGNGALQFSLTSAPHVDQWPDHVDEPRYASFLEGYESISPISVEEKRSIPNLMIEALIAECVSPIQETGSMGHWSGFRVLEMVRRKVQWLVDNRERLHSLPT